MTTRFACLLSLLSTSALLLSGCGSGTSAKTEQPDAKTTPADAQVADTAPVVKCINIADDQIADFKTNNSVSPVAGRQGGFYVYGDNSIAGTFDPPLVKDQPYPIDPSTGNPACSGPGSFHVKAANWGVWGAAMGTEFLARLPLDAGLSADGKGWKGLYDGSKYKGISFWAKATAPVSRVQVSILDAYTDGYASFEGLPDAGEADNFTSCVYAPDPKSQCSPYLVKFGLDPSYFPAYQDYQIDTTWKRFDVLFADTRQDQYVKGFHAPDPSQATTTSRLDTTHLTGMAIQVNANYVGDKASPNDFEIWVDDVNFVE